MPLSASASLPEGQSEPLAFTATVQRHSVNTSLYILVAKNGTIYEPINLPDEHNVDGTVLDVTASEVTDRASMDQAGILIYIDTIRLISAGNMLPKDNEY